MANHQQHQAKRPYAGSQPSITSYLIQSPSAVSPMTTYSISNFPAISSSSATTDVRSPPLPASVQANLLSVGMRVRKSVPEGYKTGSYSAFTLFSDATPASPSSTQMQIGEPRPRRPAQRQRAAELAPFCGILKVGGLSQQHSTWEVCDTEMNSSAIMDEEDEDDVPALSQGSTNSDVSVASRGVGKRRFEEDELVDNRDAVGMSARRIIAVPRRKGGVKASGQVHIVGQENAEDLDFGDADFLDYGLVDDLEMAGV